MLYTVERQLWNRDGILRVCFRKIRSAKTLVEEKQTFLAENFSVSEVSKVKPANRGQTNRGWMRRWMCSMLNYSRAYFIGSFFLQTTEICLTNIYYKFSYKIKKSIINYWRKRFNYFSDKRFWRLFWRTESQAKLQCNVYILFAI